MAEKDEDSPQLELPSFGFGRKRKKLAPAADDPGPEPEPVAATPEPEPDPEPAPEAPTAPLEPVVEEAPPATPEPVPAPEPVAEVPPAAEPARAPLFVDEVAEPEPATATLATQTETRPEPPPEGGERKAEKPRREVRLPAISGMAASIVTGLLVGVLTVGATWGSLRLCEVLQGTSSCGDPGFVLLVAILIATVLVGALLLRAWGIPDPGSTSFLAVGLMAVIALLFLVDVLFEWWTIIAIPIVAMLTFALSHWVTTSVIQPAED